MPCSLTIPRWESRKPHGSSSFWLTNEKKELSFLPGGLHDSQSRRDGAFPMADPFVTASVGCGTKRRGGSDGVRTALPCFSRRGLETLDAGLPGDGDRGRLPGQNRRWTDESPAGFDARVKHLRESLATLQQFNRESLPSREQLNFDLYHELLETAVQGLPFGDDPMPFRGVTPANRWMPVNQMGGIQQGAAETLATMPYQKPSDY